MIYFDRGVRVTMYGLPEMQGTCMTDEGDPAMWQHIVRVAWDNGEITDEDVKDLVPLRT